jgi:hypothetical protein
LTAFNPPDPAEHALWSSLNFRSASKELVTFAGFTDAGRFDDTWRFNVNTNSWNNISPATHPENRCLH